MAPSGNVSAPAPPVSVIVPLHNGEATIGTTLDSLAAQTAGEHLEVVVVDDGSTDEGPAVARRHPAVSRLVSQRSRGVAVARNHGALIARGDWLAFLDQDDLWHERRLGRMLPVLATTEHSFVLTTETSFAVHQDRAALARHGEDALAMVDHWVEQGTEIDALCRVTSAVELGGDGASSVLSEQDLWQGTVANTTSFFVRADHLRLAGGWSLHAKSIDDWWLMANCALLEPIVLVDEPSHLYRIHSRATSRHTRFWYPYASSLVALKYGGNHGAGDELTSSWPNRVAEHLYDEMLRDSEPDPGAEHFTRSVAQLLWPDRDVARELAMARVRRSLPRRVVTGLRRLRAARRRSQTVSSV